MVLPNISKRTDVFSVSADVITTKADVITVTADAITIKAVAIIMKTFAYKSIDSLITDNLKTFHYAICFNKITAFLN